MNGKLSTLLLVLILAGIILSALFASGYGMPIRSAEPQEPIGPQQSGGPDTDWVGYETGAKSILGVDWVFVAASALVLAALGFGIAVGYGTRKQLLDQ